MLKRMGELLVEHGALTPEQLDRIVARQARCYRPFGEIAADLFGVPEEAIWRAWAVQYARYCPKVDLKREFVDPSLIDRLSAEEAWTHRVLPLRMHDGDCVFATEESRLADAMRFLDARFEESVAVWLATPQDLDRALRRTYPAAA